MFYVYAIESCVDKRIYVGFTMDIDNRIKQHNAGRTKSTKGYKPWKLLYFEFVNSRIDARNREKYFKSGIGKEFLKSKRDYDCVQRIPACRQAGNKSFLNFR